MARGLYFSLAHGWKWMRAQPRSLAENRPRGFGSGRPAGTRALEGNRVRVPGSRSVGSCGCCRHHATPAVPTRQSAAAKPPTSPAREVRPSCRLAPSSGSRPAGPARSTRHAASAPGTRHPAPGTRHPAPGTRHSAPGTRHRPGRPGPTAAGDGTAIPRPPLPGRPPGTGSAVARYGETPVPLLPRSRNPRDTATASGSTAPPPRRAGGRHHRSDLASHGRGGGGVRRTDHRTPARPRLPVARPLIGRHAPARQHAGATPRIGDTTALCQLRVGRPGPPRVTETGLPTTPARARFQHA